MAGKTLLMSKTFWVNLIGMVGMLLTGFGIIAEPIWLKYEVVLMAVVNIGIRMVTGQPITGIVVNPELDKAA